MLQARLDALPASERAAARQASIVGHVFWDDALQAPDANAPQALPALQRAAFMKTRDTSDFEGTAERQFDHHLLHQVTYDTLLKAERKLGHGAAARWLAERTKGRGAEFLAMTGEHAERAGETALAIDCFEQAGQEAKKRYANTAAMSWLRSALCLLGDTDPGRRWELLFSMQNIASTVGDAPAHDAVHAEMGRLLERHPADERQAQLWVLQAMLADRSGDTAVSERLLWQAIERATRCGAAEWAAMGHGNLAWLRYARQDYPGARDLMDVAMRWAGQVEHEDKRLGLESRLLVLSTIVAQGLCRFDEARTAFRAALTRGEALGQPGLQLNAMQGLASTDADLCLWESSAAWATRMHDLAHTIGSVPLVAAALWHQAYAAESMGQHAESIPLYVKVVALSRSCGIRARRPLRCSAWASRTAPWDMRVTPGSACPNRMRCTRRWTMLWRPASPPGMPPGANWIWACMMSRCRGLTGCWSGWPSARSLRTKPSNRAGPASTCCRRWAMPELHRCSSSSLPTSRHRPRK